jgi:hypothetical protein
MGARLEDVQEPNLNFDIFVYTERMRTELLNFRPIPWTICRHCDCF